MIRVLYRTHDGTLRTDLDANAIATALQDSKGLLWVDLCQEAHEVCEPILLQTFGFHPLAVDDALQETHSPKIDDWGDYVYMVLHSVLFNQGRREKVDTLELDVFLGKNYVVTYQVHSMACIDRVWELCQRDERHAASGPGHLLYKIVDELVADYMPAVEALDEAIDLIEDQIFDGSAAKLLEEIFALKRALLHLRRIMAPQREVLNKLARGDFAVVASKDQMFFRDIYDHQVRLYDITESLRDLLGGALDTYLSVINNRMNEVMKTLTLITTLFMPLSFLTGFFGMNFFEPVASLTDWTGKAAFVLTLVVMVALPLSMYTWMRRRAWM